MKTLGVLVVLGALWLAGCAAGLQYTAEKSYPPRGTAAEVKIFDKVEPPEPYERIGQITWDYQRRKFEPPRLPEIVDEIKQKAWESGGDAIVVRKLEEPRDAEGVLRLSADVVRWKR